MCLFFDGSCFPEFSERARGIKSNLFVPEIGREEMKKNIALVLLGSVLLFGTAMSSTAQVKRVQMHIAGYLCGN